MPGFVQPAYQEKYDMKIVLARANAVPEARETRSGDNKFLTSTVPY